MKHNRAIAVGGSFLVLALLRGAAADAVLSKEVRQGEVEWLSTFDLKIPDGGPLLENPFAEPFSRRSFLVPQAWWRAERPQRVAAPLLRGDVRLLESLMRKAYGGWQSAEARGWKWDAWFESWDRELETTGDKDLDLPSAFAPVGRLMDFQPDNHTGFFGAPFGSGSRTAVLETSTSDACTEMKTADGRTLPLDPRDPAQAPKAARIVAGADAAERPGQYFSYPSKRGSAIAIHCGAKWIPVRVTWTGMERIGLIAEMSGTAGDEPLYRQAAPGIGYLRLPTFSKTNTELFRKLLPALPESAGHEKLLIVDLRRNFGGDNVVAQLSRWVDPEAIRDVMRFGQDEPKSCLYDALRWGYMQYTMLPLKPPVSAELRQTIQRGLDALYAPSPAGCPVTVEKVRSEWNYKRHQFPPEARPGKPRLLLLVDNFCGSDCEFTTYVLASVPGSIIVGENTFGVCQFIQPGYCILPHSRVPFRIALGRSDLYGDGRSVDGYGLDVDMVLADQASQRPAAILKLAGRWAESGAR